MPATSAIRHTADVETSPSQCPQWPISKQCRPPLSPTSLTAAASPITRPSAGLRLQKAKRRIRCIRLSSQACTCPFGSLGNQNARLSPRWPRQARNAATFLNRARREWSNASSLLLSMCHEHALRRLTEDHRYGMEQTRRAVACELVAPLVETG